MSNRKPYQATDEQNKLIDLCINSDTTPIGFFIRTPIGFFIRTKTDPKFFNPIKPEVNTMDLSKQKELEKAVEIDSTKRIDYTISEAGDLLSEMQSQGKDLTKEQSIQLVMQQVQSCIEFNDKAIQRSARFVKVNRTGTSEYQYQQLFGLNLARTNQFLNQYLLGCVMELQKLQEENKPNILETI